MKVWWVKTNSAKNFGSVITWARDMICLQKKSVICYGPDSPTYMRRMAIPIKITIVNKNNKNILMCSEQWRWDWLSPKIQREYRRPHWGMFYIIWMIVDCDDLRSSLRWKCGSIGLWQFLVWDLFFLEPPNKTGLTLYRSPNIITVHPCYPFCSTLLYPVSVKQGTEWWPPIGVGRLWNILK